MVKRKLKQNQKESDDEIESRRHVRQLKKHRKLSKEISVKSGSLFSDEELGSSTDNDVNNLPETSNTAANNSNYESFSSFLKAFSFDYEDDDEDQNVANGSVRNNENRKSHSEVSLANYTSRESTWKEKLDLERKIRILSVPSKLAQVVCLEQSASMTLHQYVKVSVWRGSVSIFGYEVEENESVEVFSTEGTGLKKVVPLQSVPKLVGQRIRKRLRLLTCYEDIDIEEFIDNIGPTTVVLVVKKLLLPTPLQFLRLYYPIALQTKWAKNEERFGKRKKLEENLDKGKELELCSTSQQSHVIDTSGDFEIVSQEVNKLIPVPDSDHETLLPRVLVCGEKNFGKSTLMRYLINSYLNKYPVLYFLDTDPGQTEYTPPGVLSLIRVTKPLLGPTFAHQKQPLKMIFLGSVTPGSSPGLYKASIDCLMKYFKDNFPNEILFVNTMGWTQGLGAVCLQQVKNSVKPSILIELVSPDPEISLTKELNDGITYFQLPSKAPSKESGTASYSPKDLRNFNLVSYLGQSQETFLPVTLINSFHPVCVSWDKIALYVMGKKVPPHRLVEAMHCSIVALCHADLSYVLKSDNPDFPMTLSEEPICECLGFGLVRASDEVNHLFYIVTPLTVGQLKNVNALIKGNIMIPDKLLLEQAIQNTPLPFTDQSQVAKTPARKGVRKRAFFRNTTPSKKR